MNFPLERRTLLIMHTSLCKPIYRQTIYPTYDATHKKNKF